MRLFHLAALTVGLGVAASASIISDADLRSFDARGFITTAGDPSDPLYSTPLNAGYDGVVALLMNTGALCSGSVLGSGLHVLTAAHCITDDFGVIDIAGIDVGMFPGDGSGLTFISASAWVAHPLWNGDFFAGNDLAIVTLAALAPATVERYDLHTDPNELGMTANVAGFGRSGSGATGDVLPAATRRQASNVFDGTNVAGNILFTDFDNGAAAQNALAFLGVTSGLGLGALEGSTAPGDSGGPAFLGGRVAGVTSFGFTTGPPQDIDATLNSSFGEVAGFTRVSTFQSWIAGIVVPEPSTGLLLAGALGLLALRRRLIAR